MSEFQSSQKLRKFRLKRAAGEIEFQEIFLDRFAQEQESDGWTERKLEIPLSRGIARAIFGAFLLLSALFLARVFVLQTFQHSQMAVLAQKNAIRTIPIPGGRGVLYDSSMTQLVFNKPSYDLLCDKRDMPKTAREKADVVNTIADIVDTPFDELAQRFDETPYPEIIMRENLTQEQLVAIEAKADGVPGCWPQENTVREYAGGGSFSHILGYTAKISGEELQSHDAYDVSEQIGKDGVEKTYESLLRGIPGTIVEKKNALGRTIDRSKHSSSEPGKSLQLWLDTGLQRQVILAMEQALRQTGATKAAAVALDPNTGGVLALVSIPSYDNNVFSGGVSAKTWNALMADPAHPLFNRVIGGIGYPTGSVIKPLVGSAALSEGIITERTKIFAPSELCVKNVYGGEDQCFHDWTFHGETDIKRAIAESVNPFFYIIGGGYENFKGLGATTIKKYLKKFGWGEQTGIDLPGEGKGILPDIGANWRLGDTYHFSIGQGSFSIPPIQVANAFAAIANNGTLLKPQVVRRILDQQKHIIQTVKPSIISDHIIAPDILNVIRQGMRQTVTAGSATQFLNGLPVAAAAKTGTAQTGRKDAAGKDYLYSWTASFAPYEKPSIVFVVVVEDTHEGQVSSLPITKSVLGWYFTKDLASAGY